MLQMMGARREGGGGGESGGRVGACWEPCEPNRSSRERCFCFMLLEMVRGPLVEGGEEDCGGVVLGGGGVLLGSTGGGTHCFCEK